MTRPETGALVGRAFGEKELNRIPIVVDTREQLPFRFSDSVVTSLGTLGSGDYSLLGLERKVAVERKSLADLVGSLTSGRARFERELQRLAGMDRAWVVIESSLEDVASHNYRSNASPKSIFGSCMAVTVRYCPVFFAGSRAMAARLTEGLLRRYWLDEIEKGWPSCAGDDMMPIEEET